MAIESFKDEWQTIKANFEKATAKKKPSEKFLGLFNKSSGITPAAKTLDGALDDGDRKAADKALGDFKKTCEAYQKTLAKAAAAETDKTVIAETKVMIGEIGNMVDQAETAVTDIAVIKRVGSLAQWTAQMKNKSIGPRVADYAKRTHNDDLLLFLGAMAKKDHSAKAYDTYIKPGSKYEINIDDNLRSQFNPADLGNAPRGKATDVVLDLYNNNIVNKLG